jgi:hypothetical protein
MNSERKTTRKDFLKWSAVAATGGVFLVGNYILGRQTDAQKTATSSESLTTMSRIRPAREAVARKRI